MGTSATVGEEAVTRVYTVRLGNIGVWWIGLAAIITAALHYEVYDALANICTFAYGFFGTKLFPWVSVRVEE